MTDRLSRTVSRIDVERAEEWARWSNEIPAISFPSTWKVRIIPPRTGAIVRFLVEHNDRNISVYLDCYDALGCVGEPYWEMYPYEGDTYRCLMADVDDLIAHIDEELKRKP